MTATAAPDSRFRTRGFALFAAMLSCIGASAFLSVGIDRWAPAVLLGGLASTLLLLPVPLQLAAIALRLPPGSRRKRLNMQHMPDDVISLTIVLGLLDLLAFHRALGALSPPALRPLVSGYPMLVASATLVYVGIALHMRLDPRD